MDMVLLLVQQVVIMFILAIIGFIMFKTGKINNAGSKSIGNILIFLSLPGVIIQSFLVEQTPERLVGLGISALVAFVLILISVIVSRLILGRHAIENFAATFSNPGFFGVPLIAASLADGAVFYVASFIAFINLGQWTYGVWLLKNCDKGGKILSKEARAAKAAGENRGNPVVEILLRLIKAPFMIAILIGLFFFLTGIEMPEIPRKCIGFMVNMNTPLAMFTIGIYLAQTDIKHLFLKKRLYLVSLARMILIPLASLAVLSLVPSTYMDMKMALLIVSACPVGSNVAVYAQLHDQDYPYAVETVIISTLLAIVTIPLIVMAAQYLW